MKKIRCCQKKEEAKTAKLLAKNRGNESYESMSDDRLLSAFISSNQ